MVDFGFIIDTIPECYLVPFKQTTSNVFFQRNVLNLFMPNFCTRLFLTLRDLLSSIQNFNGTYSVAMKNEVDFIDELIY